MKMSIFSDLKIYPVKTVEGSKLLARGSVVISNAVRVNFSVLNGSKGRFVALPSEKSNKVDEQGNIKYFPIVSIPNRELSDELNRLVLNQLDSDTPSKTASTEKPKGAVAKDGIPF
jgi:DNA-binding cell septation regulator SpoVG